MNWEIVYWQSGGSQVELLSTRSCWTLSKRSAIAQWVYYVCSACGEKPFPSWRGKCGFLVCLLFCFLEQSISGASWNTDALLKGIYEGLSHGAVYRNVDSSKETIKKCRLGKVKVKSCRICCSKGSCGCRQEKKTKGHVGGRGPEDNFLTYLCSYLQTPARASQRVEQGSLVTAVLASQAHKAKNRAWKGWIWIWKGKLRVSCMQKLCCSKLKWHLKYETCWSEEQWPFLKYSNMLLNSFFYIQ